ncbi:hypothetical protein [Hymenobacter armeniacus]|uniref:Secreted protein n=1 Tax=Hymenobacter armeniacus TaxID=2771358 RepID=A0ABR8JUU2_9BACT|nr:hypothetical protein [Hymenobacter armeniacus]MBD2722870.1 hypothetical protein [Hymenobacter armeniacus]
MFRYFFASLVLLAIAATDASAQTGNRGKKIAPYSSRGPRKVKTAVKINPHTGKPYGAGVPEDIRNGSMYLAPATPMRRQVGYTANGGYNDNRTPRPRYAKPSNSSLSRDSNLPVAPAKTKVKAKRK